MINRPLGPAELAHDYNAELMSEDLQSVTMYEPNIIVLFQTPGYARACLGRAALVNGWTEEQLDEAVGVRMARYDRLLGDAAVQKIVVVAEEALLNQRGSAVNMAETVGQVKQAFVQPPANTTLRLLPQRATPGTANLRGNFGGYTITNSPEGALVWTADAMHVDPAGSYVYEEAVSVLDLQLNNLSVRNTEAIGIVSDAAEYWKQQYDTR
jgi:hypothetical protein